MSNHIHVLVIEDDRDIAALVRSLLEKNRFRTHLFEDPLLALDIFKENPSDYALIVYDVTVRYMSAFEFLRQAREESPEIKFVLITTIEIKPSEFAKFLPTIQIDGFVEKRSLQNKLMPIINKFRDPREIARPNINRRR